MLEITTNWKLDQVFSIPVPWVKNLKKTIGNGLLDILVG